MNRLIIFLFFGLSTCLSTYAQNVAAWEDQRGRLQFFDGEKVVQLEHQKVNSFQVGDDFIIYHNNRDEIVYYRNGRSEILHLRDVMTDYTITNHFIIVEVGNSFDVIDHNDKVNLSIQTNTRHIYGDSIVAFVDLYGQLKAFHDGEKHSIDQNPPISFKASRNSFAWVDNRQWLWFYNDLERYQVTEDPPNDYRVGSDLVLYTDPYDEFYLWRDDESFFLNDFKPQSWKVGDNIAAYVDQDDNFFIIKEGETEAEMIAPETPKFYDIVENTLVYIDDQGFLNIYYKGKNTLVEYYEPLEFLYDEGVLVYLDQENRLKAFYEGEKMKVSQNMVTSFKVFGRVVLFELGNRDYEIFHDGKPFYHN